MVVAITMEAATMDSATQPILCCIGPSVAGVPTQFMMECAFEEQGLDWKTITVEVAENEFDIALSGMHAMNFSAVRFFSEFQSQVCTQFSEDDLQIRFVGAATSAAHESRGWRFWHNYGLAAIRIIGQRLSLRGSQVTSCIVVLAGNSIHTRSTFVALSQTTESEPPVSNVLWIDGPDESSFPIRDQNSDLENDADPRTSELPFKCAFASSDGIAAKLCDLLSCSAGDSVMPSDDRNADVNSSESMATTDEPEPNETPLVVIVGDVNLLPIQDVAGKFPLLLFPTSDSGNSANLSVESPAGVEVVSEEEQLIAAEASDFFQWTQTTPDKHVLRDAYEEYCEF